MVYPLIRENKNMSIQFRQSSGFVNLFILAAKRLNRRSIGKAAPTGGLIFLAAGVFATTAIGQVAQVDPSFTAASSKAIGLTYVPRREQLVQPDGRLVIWGSESVEVDGIAKGQVARLNADGSVDNGFSYCGCLLDYVTSVVLLSDGKMLVGGADFNSRAKVVRINADGSTDNSFNSSFGLTPGYYTSHATVLAAQPDGRIYVELSEFAFGNIAKSLYRLNPNGSPDTTFTTILIGTGRLGVLSIVQMLVIPTGGFYLALTTTPAATGTRARVRRYHADGALDSSFEEPIFVAPGTATTFHARIIGIDVQTDGSLVVGGVFSSVNGLPRANFVRLLTLGNVDPTFVPPASVSGGNVKVLQTGKILRSAAVNNDGLSRMYRLNSDGSIDNEFQHPASVVSVLNKFVVDVFDRILFFGRSAQNVGIYFRLDPNGSLDASYNPNVGEFAAVYSIFRQADERLIAGGNFEKMNGVVRRSLARLGTDGSLDPTLDPGLGFNSPPAKLVTQADGKILAIGNFNTYNGTPRSGLTRINPDGSLDATFSPLVGVGDFALQPDQKIVIVGNFTSVNGVARTGVARLNPDGSLDTAFNPVIGSPVIWTTLVQDDGKIMIGGTFSGVNGFSRYNLARLNADGSLDTSFNAGTSVPSVTKLWRQPDGKYLTANADGPCDSVIVRRNLDGSVDGTFATEPFRCNDNGPAIRAISVQPDGSLIVGGNFDRIGVRVRRNLARLTSNGALDVLFLPNGANGIVRTIVNQPNGKVIIGGHFTRVEYTTQAGIARILVGPLRQRTPFDFDGDGRADIGVLRPSAGDWYILPSTGGLSSQNFGVSGDISTPADYDGDGKTDLGIFRPSTGTFWYKSSINGGFYAVNWGAAGDIPRPSDFDNDGKADFVVYRPSNFTWYRRGSTGALSTTQFGMNGDQPLTGDFDGDGRGDLAIFRPSSGTFWYASSANGGSHNGMRWGADGDIPAVADFDGDARTDAAVFRPSTGSWYILNSSNGSYTSLNFGVNADRPVPADYDGDGRADIGVYRPSDGVWYLQQSTAGFTAVRFGVATDIAIPNSFVP